MLRIDIQRSSHKRSFRCKRNVKRINRIIDRTHRSRFRLLSKLRSWRILALRKAVNPVIKKDDLEIDVAADAVNEMISTNAEPVAVARNDPYIQIGITCFDA